MTIKKNKFRLIFYKLLHTLIHTKKLSLYIDKKCYVKDII